MSGLENYILNLVLVEVRYPVNDKPRKGSSKVYNLVHHKRHDPSREGVVLDIDIPGCPQPFENAKVHIVFG